MLFKFTVHHYTYPYKFPICTLHCSIRLALKGTFNFVALREAKGAIAGHNVLTSGLEVLRYVISSETPKPLLELP
jgi:hypothetical protein